MEAKGGERSVKFVISKLGPSRHVNPRFNDLTLDNLVTNILNEFLRCFASRVKRIQAIQKM